MVSKIINLTRSFVPKLSANARENVASVNAMPEFVLAKMMRDGNKGIVRVDMNHCTAARITENGINTIFTDSLCGCNAVGLITKCVDGKPLAILSHYVPTNNAGQLSALEKQLAKYEYYTDKNFKPKLLMNVRGCESFPGGELEACPTAFIDKVKELVGKFFPRGVETSVTPYPTKNRSAFFSSANIYQFDPSDLNKVKITNVGEKEKFIDLNA